MTLMLIGQLNNIFESSCLSVALVSCSCPRNVRLMNHSAGENLLRRVAKVAPPLNETLP